jgi:hypothetical protein
MTKAQCLPVRHEVRRAFDDFAQPGRVAIWLFMCMQMGEVFINHVVGQRSQVLMHAAMIEKFEMAKAHKAGRNAADHGRSFCRFAEHQVSRADQAKAARARYAQRVHSFRAQIFTDR